MAAKESKLSQLHEMLAELFMEDIRICKEEGIPMAASDKAVIVKFLKDNSITCDPDSEQMKTLRDEFSDELSARRAERAKAVIQSAEEDDFIAGGIL